MAEISQIKDSKTNTLYNIKDAQARADLQTKQDMLTFDNSPISGSKNLVKSGGIHLALATKADQETTYTKTEVNNLIVPANTEIVVVTSLPASGSANTIYRMQGTDSYTDYGWDGTQFVALATYNGTNLYDSTGSNTDGAMTQNAVTDLFSNQYSDSAVDFAITDENNKAIVGFAGGHIKTKNFDSKKVLDGLSENKIKVEDTTSETSDADLLVSDEEGNAVMCLKEGHVYTKNFSSSSLNAKVESLESSFDINQIASNIITRCRDIFAPIGESEVSYTPKRKIRILFIGNSVTQDHVGYLPWLFRQLYPDEVDFTIANFYYAGRTIKEYVEDFITGNTAGLYSHATNTSVWAQESDVYLPNAITRENWDVISIQAYTPRSAEEATYAPALIQWLRNNSPHPFELAYLMHQNFGTESVQKGVRDIATAIIKQNAVTLLFAPYFCIKEAQNYWQVEGVLSPSGDGTHLREGLPVMITGMHLMSVICNKFGLLNRIIGNGLMMTSTIQSTLNIPGGNGTVDNTLATDENYMKAQYCAVQGTKQAEAWYNKIISEMIENYN